MFTHNEIIAKMVLNQAQFDFENKPKGCALVGVWSKNEHILPYPGCESFAEEVEYRVVSVPDFSRFYNPYPLELKDITVHNIPIISFVREEDGSLVPTTNVVTE